MKNGFSLILCSLKYESMKDTAWPLDTSKVYFEKVSVILINLWLSQSVYILMIDAQNLLSISPSNWNILNLPVNADLQNGQSISAC